MKSDSHNASGLISKNAHFNGSFNIGQNTIIGIESNNIIGACQIGNNFTIGSFCILEGNVTIGDDCNIDHYCAIYSNVSLGNNVQLLYGAKIYSDTQIGDGCIIGGTVPERVIIEDNVTYMGAIAHSYRNPKIGWDESIEKSPVIKSNSVIGVNALLIGGIKVGKNCYVAAGEILRSDLPDNSIFIKNKVLPINFFRGFIKTR